MSTMVEDLCITRNLSLFAWLLLFALPLVGTAHAVAFASPSRKLFAVRTWFTRWTSSFRHANTWGVSVGKTALVHMCLASQPTLIIIVISESSLASCIYSSINFFIGLLLLS